MEELQKQMQLIEDQRQAAGDVQMQLERLKQSNIDLTEESRSKQ